LTLALTGSTHGETEPRKATHIKAGHNIKNPDFARVKIPPMYSLTSGKSKGF